ncbi:hypothetical protein [Mesohalobacter halotolerans]|uniref:Peptidase M50 domain-containing protein n=1 Tax=Mesohalobacter halotolerans TaxID=1883405 RepID=A0A4U5TRM3_9FLAO|nr:hypothetical protein [Mesohalobacter halotolerans]TKS56907.1 hypothetical protein FCN74_00325 [Mesohalobacter halotolerans]
MDIKIDIKFFLSFTLVFILFTVIGTISHEYGHIAIAKIYGYDTTLHYGSMNFHPKGYLDDPNFKALESLSENYINVEYDSTPDEVKEKANKYIKLLEKRYWDEENEKNNKSLFISIGGPLQTILTGIIGLIILRLRKKTIQINGLKILDWLAVFLSLFWLREIFNLVHSIGEEIIFPDGKWFGGDEYFISKDLNLWPGTIPILLGMLGLLISAYIVFEVVPKKLRLTFILGGLIGGISGFILWLDIIGPKVLP